MKAKLNFSDIDDRKYINTTLTVSGIFAFGIATSVSWPALLHLAHKLV